MLSYKRQVLITALAIIAGLCVAPFIIIPLFLIDDEVTNKVPAIIGLIITIIIFLSCIFGARFVRNNYKLKYLFKRKSYQEQYNKLSPYFVSLSPENKKWFDKECKTTYLLTGELLNRGFIDNKDIYKNKEKMEVLSKMVDVLCSSIKNGRGWLEFIEVCDKGVFTYKRRNFDGTILDDNLDGWEVHYLIGCVLFPRGFRYLTDFIHTLCDFTLLDNELSPEWTKENEEHKDKLEKEFNPILFAYKDDILEIQNILHNGIEKII